MLEDNEWLIKVEPDYTQEDNNEGFYAAGFLAKYNKDGTVPQNFKNWRGEDKGIHKEDFNKGWKLFSIRAGKSQDWVVLIHPLGFTLEVRAYDFLEDVLPKITIVKGEILEACRWEGKKITIESD